MLTEFFAEQHLFLQCTGLKTGKLHLLDEVTLDEAQAHEVYFVGTYVNGVLLEVEKFLRQMAKESQFQSLWKYSLKYQGSPAAGYRIQRG